MSLLYKGKGSGIPKFQLGNKFDRRGYSRFNDLDALTEQFEFEFEEPAVMPAPVRGPVGSWADRALADAGPQIMPAPVRGRPGPVGSWAVDEPAGAWAAGGPRFIPAEPTGDLPGPVGSWRQPMPPTAPPEHTDPGSWAEGVPQFIPAEPEPSGYLPGPIGRQEPGADEKAVANAESVARIKRIQRLNGFTGRDVDGIWGKETERRFQEVKEYQKANGLKEDGIKGKATDAVIAESRANIVPIAEGRAVAGVNMESLAQEPTAFPDPVRMSPQSPYDAKQARKDDRIARRRTRQDARIADRRARRA